MRGCAPTLHIRIGLLAKRSQRPVLGLILIQSLLQQDLEGLATPYGLTQSRLRTHGVPHGADTSPAVPSAPEGHTATCITKRS